VPGKKQAQELAQTALKELVEYKNPEHGFSIKYPQSWQKEEPKNTGVICKFKTLNGLVSYRLAMDQLPAPMALDAYTKVSIEGIKVAMVAAKMPLKTVEQKSGVFGGVPATEIIYTLKMEGSERTAKARFILATYKSRGYVFYYTADSQLFDTFMPVIRAVVESMKFL